MQDRPQPNPWPDPYLSSRLAAGVMVKHLKEPVRPLNADIPFVALLPDLIRAVRDRPRSNPPR